MPNIQQTLPTEATSPEASITAEKERTKTLARWISTALATLETIDPDDMEDGGTGMRSLIADGQSLVSAVLQGRDLVPDRRKVQTANHPMRRATDWPQIDVALGAVPLPTANSPEIAGMQSAIGHLSRLVGEQRALLVEVEDVCGRDGLGGTLEDGESELIDKVRRHLGMLNATEPAEKKSRAYIDLFATTSEWLKGKGIYTPSWLGDLLSVLSGHVSGTMEQLEDDAQGPIGYMSPQQLHFIKDVDAERGNYVPLRKTPVGLFTLPLYLCPDDQTVHVQVPPYIGACITDGRLHVTVMQRGADKRVTVLATAEMDAASLTERDCIAQATAPAMQPVGWESQIPTNDRILSACEKAGLWPNTAASWVENGAFRRFFEALKESEE